MGSALSCFDQAGSWDHTQHVRSHYRPKPEHDTPDMTLPLSHYFISSGHNSYLQGNQLTSTAGTQTIELCLKHGCRVVELDVYDGPTEPVVTHGGTLTSTVTFHDCVKAVARHAFAASPYPVILTLENHAKMPQQAEMARTLHSVLGKHLFVPQPDRLVSAEGNWLSPAALKHKVVIRMKVKPDVTDPELEKLIYIRNSSLKGFDVINGPPHPTSSSLPDSKLPMVSEYAPYISTLTALFDYHSPQMALQAAAERGWPLGASAKRRNASSGSLGGSTRGGSPPDAPASKAAGRSPSGKTKQDQQRQGSGRAPGPAGAVVVGGTEAAAGAGGGGAGGAGGAGTAAAAAAAAAAGSGVSGPAGRPALAHDAGKLRSFRLPPDDVVAEEHALQEEEDDTLPTPRGDAAAAVGGTGGEPAMGAGVSATPLSAVLAYTSKHLLRCYPSGWRMVDNSNPNPAAAWACGISLAALNWQLWDRAVWVNEAFFSRYNHSGYIPKPDWMTSTIPEGGLPPADPKTLSVKVYSAYRHQGRRVSVWKDDLYVELQVVGMPQDTAVQASPHQNNTGRLVVDRTFDFSVSFPELAVLLVLLKDQDNVMTDTVLGYAAMPLATLQPGAYQLRLAEPKPVDGLVAAAAAAAHPHMWVKLELQWQQEGGAAAPAAGAAQAPTAAAAAAAAAAPAASTLAAPQPGGAAAVGAASAGQQVA